MTLVCAVAAAAAAAVAAAAKVTVEAGWAAGRRVCGGGGTGDGDGRVAATAAPARKTVWPAAGGGAGGLGGIGGLGFFRDRHQPHAQPRTRYLAQIPGCYN